MAMGMHAPASIPRLRRPKSPSLPSGVGCFSYRRHSTDVAVSTERYRKATGIKTANSTDKDWVLRFFHEQDVTNKRADFTPDIRKRSTIVVNEFDESMVTNYLTSILAKQEMLDTRFHTVVAEDANRTQISSNAASCSKVNGCSRISGERRVDQMCASDQIAVASDPASKEKDFSGLSTWAKLPDEVEPTSGIPGRGDCGNQANTDVLIQKPGTVEARMIGCGSVGAVMTNGCSRISGERRVDQMCASDQIALASDPASKEKDFSGLSSWAKLPDEVEPTSGIPGRGDCGNQANTDVLIQKPGTVEASMISCGSVRAVTLPLSQKVLVRSDVAQLACTIEDVFVVDNVVTARQIVDRLRGEYKDLVHACDTEVSEIDVKKESPVGHGKVICFSIYCGPNADLGDGRSCVWVDTLGANQDIITVFKDYFEDSSIKKVWHNFSFDRHVLANHGIRVEGFYADTMHLARLWHSGRKGAEGSYSLESLTSDIKAMNGVHEYDAQTMKKKVSMMELFGSRKLKKDGTEGCTKVIPPVEDLQRSESMREKWICYSSGDALCTWRLWESLHQQLESREWYFQKRNRGSMYDFYHRFWRPFGELLAEMEGHGMLVDRGYLAEIEKIACKERATSINRFRKWAAKYCPYAQYINVTSDAQIRQLLFGGFKKVSKCRSFKVPNIDGYIEEGKKAPLKFRTVDLCGIGVQLPCEILTSGGLPTVSMQALKNLAGKVSVDYSGAENEEEFIPGEADMVLTSDGLDTSGEPEKQKEEDLSVYGPAYHAFKGGQEGREACKAIAALCEVSAIDTLISGFIQPLQGGDIMGPDNRVHCSLNLNTETGRLSARRPNLQNQPALEKDRYKIRQAFVASPGNSLIVADYGQLELRLLAHLADCKSMLEAFKVGGDFHSRTAMNMYSNVKKAVESGEVLLEWEPKPGENAPPSPLLKDVFAAERRKAKMLNFSIAYGKTAKGLAKDWKVSLQEAQLTLDLWYKNRPEVRIWQEAQKMNARQKQCVYTLLGRPRHFPDINESPEFLKGRVDRAAINTPVQGSAADVAMLSMIEISRNRELKQLGWKLLLQVHDEMILEGPSESAAYAKDLVVRAMSHPFEGENILKVDLVVDAKYASSWYAAK